MGTFTRKGMQLSKAPPERIDPRTVPPGIVAHHLAKYRLAASLLSAGRILDVGCGVGYGTATLAASDREVIGVDVAPEALDVARTRYAGKGVSFQQMDGEDLHFPDGSFNGVICFEAIEHFHHPERHLSEVVRLLRPDGVYLMSTPQPGHDADPAHNPHHHHEFSRQDLERLLRGAFDDVVLRGQHRRQSSSHRAAQRADVLGVRRLSALRPLARLVSKALGTRATEDAVIEDFLIDEDGLKNGTEFVGVCRLPRRP